ncbi:MAG TPA: GMC family oxidoreductase [Caulobacteraceae bacterium]|nr:GMC family oxidoreductase [Caulobacteraceae bacterium]
MDYDADVIVVGSGTVGANVAHELAKKGKSVIILEAGVRVPRWKIVEAYRNSGRKYDRNDPYPNMPWALTSYADGYIDNTGSFPFFPGALKVVGGTTLHWSSAVWRFIPNDFKMKSLYGVLRDWPISYDALEPYYGRAELELGVSGSDTDDQSGQGHPGPYPPRSIPYPVPPEPDVHASQVFKKNLEPHGYKFVHEPNCRTWKPINGRPACRGNNNCVPICPIGAQYDGTAHVDLAIDHGAKLVTDATVFKIERGQGGKIAAVHYRTSKHQDVRLTAKAFVVAGHALETPKLLLMNDVANSSDQVGRNLMDHTGTELQFLANEPIWMGRGPVQQARIMNWRDGPFRSQHSAIKHDVHNANPIGSITQRLISQGVMGKELDERILDESMRWAQVTTFYEMPPLADNRITLHPDRRDALGFPTLRIHYDVPPYVLQAFELAKGHYAEITRLMQGEKPIIGDFANHSHIVGTTLMGDDPKDSVVDKDGRTHDHANLFIAGCSILPTCSVLNPTLTAVALAIRSADIIAAEV